MSKKVKSIVKATPVAQVVKAVAPPPPPPPPPEPVVSPAEYISPRFGGKRFSPRFGGLDPRMSPTAGAGSTPMKGVPQQPMPMGGKLGSQFQPMQQPMPTGAKMGIASQIAQQKPVQQQSMPQKAPPTPQNQSVSFPPMVQNQAMPPQQSFIPKKF